MTYKGKIGPWRSNHQGRLVRSPSMSSDSMLADDINKNHHRKDGDNTKRIVTYMANFID